MRENYPHLRDIEFADSLSDNGPMKIDLLIGSDYIWNFFNLSTTRGDESVECGPVAVSATVGWVLSGPVKNLPKERLSSIHFSSTHILRVGSRSNETLYEDFEKPWDLDFIGIRENGQANYGHLEHKFGLFEDENEIVRCQGRIPNADLPYETRFPALSRYHYISTLLVRQALERVHQSKVAANLTQLRMRFWIARERQLVKKIISRFTVCRRCEGVASRCRPSLICLNSD